MPLLNGAYAELLVVPERIARVNLHPVPRTLASEVAALVEPLACALHAVEGIEPGQTVAVLGPGPMGMLLCACLKDAGVHVVITGGSAERRALAEEFGAVQGDPCGADVVIEATGKPKGWHDAVLAVRRGGTVVFFSGVAGPVDLDAERIHYDELTVRGVFSPHAADRSRSARLPCERRLPVGQAADARACARAAAGVSRRAARRLPEGDRQAVKSVRSGSRSPRRSARSTSTQRMSRDSASVTACGFSRCAARIPRQPLFAGSSRMNPR